MATSKPKTLNQALNEEKKNWHEKIRTTSIDVPVQFGSYEVLHLYQRTFSIVSVNTYYLHRLFSERLGDVEMKKVWEHIDEAHKTAHDKLTSLDSQLEAVIKDANISSGEFTKTEHIQAKVVSPIAKRYLNLLSFADKVLLKNSRVWLEGEINNTEWNVNARAIRNIVRKFSSTLTALRNELNKRLRDLEAQADKSPGLPLAESDNHDLNDDASSPPVLPEQKAPEPELALTEPIV